MYIEINSNKIKVIIERKNIKNLYMKIKEDLCLHVTCNKFVSEKEIINIINNNVNFIIKAYNKMINKVNDDINYNYLGNSYNIVFSSVKSVYLDSDNIYTKDEKMLEKYTKNQCILIFNERINRLLTLFEDIPKFTLKIRAMKTRWGVCNRSNMTITLNSELIKKDINLIDYVIIHEICHFKHFNHSKSFWNCVSKYYPYYKEARKQLNNY